MKEVIRIPEVKQVTNRNVEVTHYHDGDNGWIKSSDIGMPEEVVYLGKCKHDGDMFAAYEKNCIVIYKGHLNSGKY